MSKSMRAFAIVMVFGSAALLGSTAFANPSAPWVGVAAENPNLVQIETAWERNQRGRRCLHRTGECRFLHRGFFYEKPWWNRPQISGGTRANRYHNDNFVFDDDNKVRLGPSHLNWCQNRYRSYNPRTNTWRSYRGSVRQCFSPFS